MPSHHWTLHPTLVIFVLFTAQLVTHTNALSSSNKSSQSAMSRRASIQNIFLKTFAITTTVPSIAIAVTDEGIPAITDSSFGRSFRKLAIQGARKIDSADEKWERFSDSLRDQNKCDENTGRRLFDNGFRKDGTRIGNPVLGSMCNPQPLLDFDEGMADRVLDLALQCAGSVGADVGALKKSITETEELVRPSFERSIQVSENEQERKRKTFNFALYSRMRAISSVLNNPTSVKKFQIAWGRELLSMLAPTADRRDYVSPFPDTKDEFEDYDYDKNSLLDALGALRVSLDKLSNAGLIGYSEISIPYDDYGSVVTVAIDDYVPIGAEMLLSEQNYSIAGPATALIRTCMDKAKLNYGLDSFYLDPSTTKQSVYEPSQLLLSLSNLRKI